ncbi:hypothetical protein D3C71_2098490 [compost metagenome]
MAKGHGALAAHPGGHFLIGTDQAIRAYRQYNGTQLVEYFIGAIWLGGDFLVQAD